MFKRTAKPTREKKNIERTLNNMTDFEKIKRALVEGGFKEGKHFDVCEWAESKDITLNLCDNLVRVEFEFDNKGNLLFIS